MSQYSNLTPFAAAQVTNKILQLKGYEGTIRPQMLYSYAKKGTISSNYLTRSEGEKILFDGDDFKVWLDRYIQRIESGTESTRVDYDKLAEQYM